MAQSQHEGTQTQKLVVESRPRRIISQNIDNVDTSSDEDEQGSIDESDDDELDDEERLLQRTILLNFLGRQKKDSLRQTRVQYRVTEREESQYGFSISHYGEVQSDLKTSNHINHFDNQDSFAQENSISQKSLVSDDK